MMSSVRIPESAYPAIQHLISFSDPNFDAFLDALSRAEPSLDQDKFWKHVSMFTKDVDQSVIESILREIFQMDDARLQMRMGIEEFVKAITEGLVKSGGFSFGDTERNVLRNRLKKIFEGRKGLSITMKAMGVVLNQERVFLQSQILTDIRPVFDQTGDAVDSVDAAVIVHNLRIHYLVDSDHKDFYVALDTSDIQSIREMLDRAEAKAECLKRLLKNSGVSYLEAEE